MSRLEDAEVFVAVVDAAGFTAAAAALGVSQPAVSRRVAALETRLGVRLLARSTRRLRPTDAGAAFYEHARRALGVLEEGECEAAAANADLRGSLRVTAPPAYGRHVVVPALAAFGAAHPAITVDLVLAERRLDLTEERVDLAVRIDDPGRASELIHARVGGFDVVTCAAPIYLAARGAPRTPADLAAHACLLQAGPTRAAVWTFTPVSRAGGRAETATVQVGGPLRTNDVEALAAATRAGMGIARVPDFLVAADIRRGTLRRVLPRFATRRVDVFAVYSQRRHLPARTRALLDFLTARLRGRRR
jgi:DNA-binding transcriptional LysR family regulator